MSVGKKWMLDGLVSTHCAARRHRLFCHLKNFGRSLARRFCRQNPEPVPGGVFDAPEDELGPDPAAAEFGVDGDHVEHEHPVHLVLFEQVDVLKYIVVFTLFQPVPAGCRI